MRVKDVEVPTTPTNIIQLTGIKQTTWSGVFLQAPNANPDTILFGDPSVQKFELRPRRNAFFPISDAKSMHIVAPNPGNRVTIAFL